MKKTYQLLLMLITSFALCGCGGDDANDSSSSGSTPSPGVNVILRSQSISAGAEVDAATTTVLTLNYNTTVKVTGVGITLNGTAVTAKSSATTTMSVDIPLALEDGKSYEVKVAKGAIVSTTDASASAPEFTLNFTTKAKATPGTADNTATALTKRLGWGWNLGNHFDTSSGKDGVHPEWGYWDKATPTATLYVNLKKAGASTVRIGVTWGNYQNASWDIEASFMNEVKQNVEWAEQAGLNVILNMHHDEYWLDIKGAANNASINTAIKERIAKTWTQIAEAFKDKGDFLLFESYNEIQDGQWGWGANRTDGGKQYKTLNEWNQLVVNTIRATGGNNATRWIGIPAYASSPSFALEESFVLPNDPANKVMVSVHFYDPNTFTLTPENSDGKSEWGHTAAAGKFQSGSNEEHVREIFSKLYEKFIVKNIPVYIGEYGCVMHTSNRSNLFRNYYLEYVCRAAYTYSMPVCIWDNNSTGGGNEHHGYFNHNDGSYLNNMESLVQTMIKATTSTDANYTLESVYNKAP
ncbi:MAG: glycoside hydrolase family 5 protein [Prevotella sp.]|nr:glycoside hydrolase family 5 protein [Prevotella sp.]